MQKARWLTFLKKNGLEIQAQEGNQKNTLPDIVPRCSATITITLETTISGGNFSLEEALHTKEQSTTQTFEECNQKGIVALNVDQFIVTKYHSNNDQEVL